MCHVVEEVTRINPRSWRGDSEVARGMARASLEDKKVLMDQMTNPKAKFVSLSKRQVKCAMMCYRAAGVNTTERCTDGLVQNVHGSEYCCYEDCPTKLAKWYAFSNRMCNEAAQLN